MSFFDDLVEESVDCLQRCANGIPYLVAFSGGKDSIVLLDLVKKSGVSWQAYMNLTSVDPPELLRFVRAEYPEVRRIPPRETMWGLIEKKLMPPTRLVRYCCEFLKEKSAPKITMEQIVCIGVRKEESVGRRNYLAGVHKHRGGNVLYSILEWASDEIWEYIHTRSLPYPSLYDEGFHRLGCVGCPQAGVTGRQRQFNRWPHFKKMYLRAFERCLERRIRRGLPTTWKTGQEMFDWWMSK